MNRRTLLAVALCALCALAGCGAVGSPPTTGETDATQSTGVDGAGANDTALAPQGATLNATVVDVADGDTVDVRLANGTTETVRLVGVDTPEVWVRNTPAEFRGMANTSATRGCLRSWGHRASDYTKRLDGARVTLAFDPNTDRRGYYGRLLAYVYANGTNQNYALVERGLARVYTESDFSRKAAFLGAADAAHDARAGLWQCGAGETDGGADDDGTEDRTSTDTGGDASPLAVASVHADAAGPDGDNLNDEYVVLRNGGDDAIDLGGATVADEADHTYTFPADTTLDAGASLTLHTGSGDDAAGEYYWGSERPIWNNGGDTVIVRSANDTLLARHTYA